MTDLSLPIDTVLPSLREALARGHAVLQAPTGSGKSTRVPLALLTEAWLGRQRILMLEPRRPAARMTAARMASVLGGLIGEQVGYQVRFERRIGQETKIEVITEGILTRRLQSDPGLDGVGLVIFDEFHERNLQSDLGLALCLDVAANLRPDLRLLVMSATLDTEPVAELLGGAPIIRGEGQCFPVTVLYADREHAQDVVQSVVGGIRRALTETDGDILAFLPGAGEIDRCRHRLADVSGVDVHALHGGLAAEMQDRALLPGQPGRRRIIVATDIAETSVTIQGVSVVVDSGLTRKPHFDPGSGLSRLITEPIPRASADQRSGRAGRLGPGVCYRLWTRAQEHGRAAHRSPEILQSDLAPLALELALWGVKDPMDLCWIDPPPAPAWSQAVDLLQTLGALDAKRTLTRLGRALAELPLHPRLGVMLLGAASSARPLAARLCALIAERDPLLPTPGQARPVDLGLRLQAIEDRGESHRTAGMDRMRLAAIERASQQLIRLAGNGSANGAMTPGTLLGLAYPDRIAQRRDGPGERYLLASGAGAVLPRDDALAIHPYLVVAAMDASGRDGRIQLALPISESELREHFADRIRVEQAVSFDEERETVIAREVTRLGAIVLASRPMPLRDSTETAALLTERIRRGMERALNWTNRVGQLQARVALLRAHDPSGGWPDLSLDTLRDTLDDWLAPWLDGKLRLSDVRALDLNMILTARLSWEQRQRLDSDAPESFITPAGNRRPLDYLESDVPVLAVPLQELFGLSDTPTVCGGRIPVLLHLLSPARRPMQVTQDLAGFWTRGYAEVRKELRGRYPKHHWPEDPTQAQAVVGGIRRRATP